MTIFRRDTAKRVAREPERLPALKQSSAETAMRDFWESITRHLEPHDRRLSGRRASQASNGACRNEPVRNADPQGPGIATGVSAGRLSNGARKGVIRVGLIHELRHSAQRRLCLLTVFACCAVLVPVGVAAGAVGASSSALVLQSLNAERAANGLPRTEEAPAWSAKCQDHAAYMSAVDFLTHDESKSSPNYSPAGSWAGENSVLAGGYSPGGGDAFADAPLHLIQLMSPELRQVGIGVVGGYLCITTWPGYKQSGWRKPTVYTYPSDGSANVPYAETALEDPFVPGGFVGLSQGTTTGYNVMVYAEGVRNAWFLKITSATLVGPDGPVAVKTLDRMSKTVGPYLPPGSGFIIPVAPLQPSTTYHATVVFKGGLKHSWKFTTGTTALTGPTSSTPTS